MIPSSLSIGPIYAILIEILMLIMDAKPAGPTPMLMAAKMLMETKVRGQPAFTQEALDELFGA